jgi:hypothetical protein
MASGDQEMAAGRVYAELPPRERRVLLRRAAGRTVISIAALVAIFIVIPPDRLALGEAFLQLAIGGALILGLVAWEVWRIISDPYPEVRAVTGLVVLVTAVITLFALTYATMSAADPAAFNQALDKGTAVYFTVTTLTTTGFGDIAATSDGARWVVTAQMLFDLILLVGLARIIILAAKAGRLRRSREAG